MATLEAGTFTAFPYSNWEQEGMDAFPNDSMGRVLVQPADPSVIYADRWRATTDKRTGKRIAMRSADCGGGCRCATEVKFL